MEIRRLHKEQQDCARVQSGDTEFLFRQFRKDQQDYASVAAAQTTKLVEMMEGLAKRQEEEGGLKEIWDWKTLFACWFCNRFVFCFASSLLVFVTVLASVSSQIMNY